jgi:FAD/FMN-containing dehydrogenase
VSIPGADAHAAHADGVRRLIASYRAIPRNASVRLAKPTSNLFRARTKRKSRGLDTSGLTSVVAVNPHARTADVAGMCTYEDLVAATLPSPGWASSPPHSATGCRTSRYWKWTS